MGLVGGVSWGGMMRCSLLFAARRGAASSYAGLLFGPLPSGWGVMVGPPRPSRCCRCCSSRSGRWRAEIVAPLVRRARTLVAVRRRARACLRARLRSGRDVGGTMFGSPRGRHDAAANSGCRGRGADAVAPLLQRSRALVVVRRSARLSCARAGARGPSCRSCVGRARTLSCDWCTRGPRARLRLDARGGGGWCSAPRGRSTAIVFCVARRRLHGNLSSLLDPFRGLSSDYRLTTVTRNRAKEKRKRLHAN